MENIARYILEKTGRTAPEPRSLRLENRRDQLPFWMDHIAKDLATKWMLRLWRWIGLDHLSAL